MAYEPELQKVLELGSVFAKELQQELLAEGFPADLVTDKHDGGQITCAFDHICFRVESESRYAHWKDIFEKHAQISRLKETVINGRNIAVYKLPHPFGEHPSPLFQVIELPAPKKGSPYKEGWEHGEVALTGTPFQGSFDKFMRSFPQFNARWDFSGFSKDSNADIALKLESGKSVKFHLETLESVIKAER